TLHIALVSIGQWKLRSVRLHSTRRLLRCAAFISVHGCLATGSFGYCLLPESATARPPVTTTLGILSWQALSQLSCLVMHPEPEITQTETTPNCRIEDEAETRP